MTDRSRFFGRRERFVALRSKILKKRKRRRPRLRSFAPALVALAVLALLGAAVYGGMKLFHRVGDFPVRTIIVEGNQTLSRGEILRLAALRPALNLFGYDIHEAKRSLEREPYVKHAVVTREIPDTVRIEIVERQPIALVEGRPSFLVDASGVLLPLRAGTDTDDLPCIVGVRPGRRTPGQRLAVPGIESALTILGHYRSSELKQLITIRRVDIRLPEDIRLVVIQGRGRRGQCLIHCGPDRYDQRLANCIAILKSKEGPWREIDLRPMKRIPATGFPPEPGDSTLTSATNP